MNTCLVSFAPPIPATAACHWGAHQYQTANGNVHLKMKLEISYVLLVALGNTKQARVSNCTRTARQAVINLFQEVHIACSVTLVNIMKIMEGAHAMIVHLVITHRSNPLVFHNATLSVLEL